MEGKTLADIGREMEAYRRAGMAGCKFKVGGLTPEEDARRVEAARRAAGDDFVLAVDANCAWSAEEAVRFARLVEPLGIAWFEEPCHWYDDAAMMAQVRQATRSRSPPARREITSHGVRRLLDAGAVDLVNVDASECGGVTEWRRAAALARPRACRWRTTRSRRSPQHLLAGVPTAPTPSASPTPSAIRSGRRCGRTGAPKDGTIECRRGPRIRCGARRGSGPALPRRLGERTRRLRRRRGSDERQMCSSTVSFAVIARITTSSTAPCHFAQARAERRPDSAAAIAVSTGLTPMRTKLAW